MVDYLQKIKDEGTRTSGLRTRMKDDVDLLRAKYVMEDKDSNRIPDIVNVTLNKLSLFAAFATSELSKAVQQVVVESEDKDLDTAYIEGFQDAAFDSANDKLRRQNRVQLNPFFDIQNCFRGRSAARCLFYMDKDNNLVTDITPWDTYYVRYGLGSDGLAWAAYGVGLERFKDDIESQPWAIKKKFTIKGKKAEVIDVWDTEGNFIYVDKALVYEQEHHFDFCPVAIQIVPLGYGGILQDKDSLTYEGESIFFLIRDLVPELNRVISISQTLNFKAVKPPMKAKLKGGEPPEYEEVTASGAMTKIEPDEDISPIDYGDIKRAAELVYNILEKAIQEGSLTNVDIGDPRQPFSAVALVQIGETRGQVLLPRLATKSLLNESLAEMFTQQVILLGGSVEIGRVGHKRTFQTSKLDGEYSTEYKYFIKSPKEDIARYSIAGAAGDLISNKMKRETILQLEDPEGEQRQLDVEDAERLFPSIKADRVIKSLLEEDRDYEAELASAQMGIDLQAILRGEIPKVEPAREPTQVQATMPTVGIGDEKTSAKKAAELEATPEGGI